MSTKESRIAPRLKQLVALFGDRLEGLTAIDKLDLIAIFALWRSADTDRQQSELSPISLTEYLELNPDLQVGTRREVDDALLVSLPCQLRDGVYAG